MSLRERENFGKDESYGVLFNENGAWEITYRGARPLDQKRIDTFRDGTLRSVFYILRQRLNEPGMDFFSRGADLYENRPVEIVDITDAEGLTTTVYFSSLDKLPVRQLLRRRAVGRQRRLAVILHHFVDDLVAVGAVGDDHADDGARAVAGAAQRAPARDAAAAIGGIISAASPTWSGYRPPGPR